MSDLNEVSRAIGSLEAKVETLTTAVGRLAETVEGLQKKSWTAKGILAGLALTGGAAGSKIAALLGMTGGTPPAGH
jgi:hypothetical protein